MDKLIEYEGNEFHVRYALDENPDDKEFRMHLHERFEIFYFISGKASYLVEGSEYSLEPGSMLIMRNGESHRAKILESIPFERYAINFSLSMINNIDPMHLLIKPFNDRPLGRGNLYSPAEFENFPIEKIISEMCICTGDAYYRKMKVYTHIYLLLDKINEAYQKRDAVSYMPPQNTAERIVAYVNEHLFDELTIPFLANHFYLSTSQFSRLFKKSTGAAPWKYITIKRLTAAKNKITCGITANTAAEDCGFKDYTVFYRAYTKYFRHSPKNERSNSANT